MLESGEINFCTILGIFLLKPDNRVTVCNSSVSHVLDFYFVLYVNPFFIFPRYLTVYFGVNLLWVWSVKCLRKHVLWESHAFCLRLFCLGFDLFFHYQQVFHLPWTVILFKPFCVLIIDRGHAHATLLIINRKNYVKPLHSRSSIYLSHPIPYTSS